MGTLLTSVNFVDIDAVYEAILNDISSAAYDEAARSLELTRATYWIQRDLRVVLTMWEGAHIDTFLERLGSSTNPFLGRWRGLLRLWSGPEEADHFWEASRHRLLCWGTEEQGAESEVTIWRDTAFVDLYRQESLDFEHNPSMRKLLDRVRRDQGFTRIETWHQEVNGEDIVLTLVEAHDLKAAMSRLAAEDNELDKRLMNLVRAALVKASAPPRAAQLFARWQA